MERLLGGLGPQVGDCEALVEPKTKESCFEKAAPCLGGRLLAGVGSPLQIQKQLCSPVVSAPAPLVHGLPPVPSAKGPWRSQGSWLKGPD